MSNTVIQTKHRFRLALGRGPEAVTASALTVAATATTAVTHGRRIAQRQCRGMGVGRLDTLHLPGYAVGPFLVTNSDDGNLTYLTNDGVLVSVVRRLCIPTSF